MSPPAPKVRVGVGAFILASSPPQSPENPSFLLGRRINTHGAGAWATPGGHLEFGESPETCAAREILEETGLKVRDVRFLTATNDFMPSEDRHYVTLFVTCVRENEGDEPRVLEPEKCEAWEWVDWGDLLRWVELEAGSGTGIVEKKMFTPLLNLVRQRPGVRPGNG